MKVLLINGSPHENGNTRAALDDVIEELQDNGIQTELYWVGMKAVHGCIACGKCNETHRCIFNEDIVNEVLDEMEKADGLIVGSPTYYANSSGTLRCIMDRLFYAGNNFAHKPAAAIAVARRAGTLTAIDEMQKYFTISEMPVVSSTYWPMEFGQTAGQTRDDLEGIYTMKRLARNMAWLLKCIDAGKQQDIKPPRKDSDRPWTNFIRE
ncbi:MAG: flavodoxin family protein [Eubacteriaceae bacterium]|jgi:multimeric flavodoxin WrbA